MDFWTLNLCKKLANRVLCAFHLPKLRYLKVENNGAYLKKIKKLLIINYVKIRGPSFIFLQDLWRKQNFWEQFVLFFFLHNIQLYSLYSFESVRISSQNIFPLWRLYLRNMVFAIWLFLEAVKIAVYAIFCFTTGNRKRSFGEKSGEYGQWDIISTFLSLK